MLPLIWKVFQLQFYHNRCNILLQRIAQPQWGFSQTKMKRSKFRNRTSTSICYKVHGIQCRLFVAGSNNVYVSSLSTSMVHNLLSSHYTHLGHSYNESSHLWGVLKIAFIKTAVTRDRIDVQRWAYALLMHLETHYMIEYLTSLIDAILFPFSQWSMLFWDNPCKYEVKSKNLLKNL